MCGREVGGRGTGKCEAVDEEEAKDDDDAGQDAPPEALVHSRLDVLLALHKVLHCEVERVQGPDVKSGQSRGQGQDNQEHEWSGVVRTNSEGCDSVDDTKNKVCNGQPANNGHRLSERRLDNTVAHTHDEQQEEREGITEGIQHSHNDHEDLRANVVAMAILVVVEAPGHKHFHDQEYQNGCDVVLDCQNIVPILVVQETPEQEDDKVYDCDAAIEGELRDLRRRKLTVRVAERDDGFIVDVFGVCSGSNAVVACLDRQLSVSTCDWVVDRLGVVKMDGFGANVHLRNRVGVVGEDPLAFVCTIAELRIDCIVVADV